MKHIKHLKYSLKFKCKIRTQWFTNQKAILWTTVDKVSLPHCLQCHREQMQHYAVGNHSLSQVALAKAPDLHYKQYQLGCGNPTQANTVTIMIIIITEATIIGGKSLLH